MIGALLSNSRIRSCIVFKSSLQTCQLIRTFLPSATTVSSSWESYVRWVHRSLDDESVATFVHAFDTSRLDYYNTVTPRTTTDKLQRVMNGAARIVRLQHAKARNVIVKILLVVVKTEFSRRDAVFNPQYLELCYSVASVCHTHSLKATWLDLTWLVCTERILAKRCVIEQKLLLTPIWSRIWEIDWYQIEEPWPLFRGRIKVTSTIALHLTLNISETVRDRGLVPKEMAYGLSNGHVTDDVT